jgi:hypothetical protein
MSLFKPRDPFERRQTFLMGPLGMLYDLLTGFQQPSCFPVLRGSNLENRSEDNLEQSREEHRKELVTAKKEMGGDPRPLVPLPTSIEPLPEDPVARSTELKSLAQSIGKMSSTDVALESIGNPPNPTPTVTTLPPTTPTPTLTPPPTTLPVSGGTTTTGGMTPPPSKFGPEKISQMMESYKLGGLASRNLQLPDPMLDQMLNDVKPTKAQAAMTESDWDLVDQMLKRIDTRVKEDDFLCQKLVNTFCYAKFKGPGVLTTLADLKAAVKSTKDGKVQWPEAKAAWKAFKQAYGQADRNMSNMVKQIGEIAQGLDRLAAGENMIFSGTLARDDFDVQELNKLNDILLGGPREVWGGRIEKAYTGESVDVDHFTIPSSNKTLFFRWEGEVLHVHGKGHHTRSNTEYEVTNWSSGRRFKIDLNKKKSTVAT